ncbi:NUDIX hydrolase [Corynebacterium bovis]|uniref:8-oxo-dGTP pyrophosphatase MutT (NUDIX family) n=2 Tax=Corynebacterium bovis TaxID=36808 RepID=A0A8H9Y723_9CORY|nr:CoA pyrophosphatase [Corynebacterium bovis]MBB3116207.1 8-oxo-dGTP pyrophosphatase MutT (NUDIX family) [Corynebacterium bovis DSM 20582 = CIP 54.80]QQC47121.1 CoA pyrophosphatase [Corynebacterium bovis]RRO79460.1 CoA pyrophosphatase [Corynebacterium bovis]RRO80762.1 CoA pyrophosphatase [Corynebacterium bovis]RRO82172.1 CoA pyrophosphatase [Corynebacterium bovis]
MTYTFDDWYRARSRQPDPVPDVPPWLAGVTGRARSSTLDRLLPGPGRAVPETDDDGVPPRYSAVLVLLGGDPDATETPGDASLLLTHRTPTMRTHSGQVAFPGGRREPGDAGPVATALREAVEETGLDPAGVDPLAVCREIYIPGSNSAVVPVLAYWRRPVPVRPATTETDWVAPVPLATLADPARRSRVGLAGWSGPAFDLGPYLLWGFTGGVVSAVLDLGGWARPWDDGTVRDLVTALGESGNGEPLGTLDRRRHGADAAPAPDTETPED